MAGISPAMTDERSVTDFQTHPKDGLSEAIPITTSYVIDGFRFAATATDVYFLSHWGWG